MNLTTSMRQHLPDLILAVKRSWSDYHLSPDHDQINAMRGEVQLLVYWLARRVAMMSHVQFRDEAGRQKQAGMGGIGGIQVTELQHDLYGDVLGKRSVTELVEGAQTDFVAFLTRILVNAKISRYRRVRTEGEIIVLGEDMLSNDDEDSRNECIEDILSGPDYAYKSAQFCAEAIQCLEQFEAFIEEEKLHPKLELVAWELWLSAPLSGKDQGDTSDNKANQDAALAKKLGMPKKTFDRYKPQAKGLVTRFREKTGW